MRVRPPIVLGKLTDDCRLHLDNAVHSKLTNSGTLSKWLDHVESTISAEAAVQFCHPPPPNHNLAGQSHRTKSSINLIKEKNLLLAEIKSSPLPEQKIALDHLLHHVKSKKRSLPKAEKSCKRRWLLKKTRTISNIIFTRLVNLCLTPSALFL